MIYFDNAATTFPKPKSVIDAVSKSLLIYSANPGRSGHKLSEQAAAAVYSAREETAKFFNAEKAENVIFTPNCTTSINIILKGLLNDGDRVLISSLEHNAVARPLEKLKAEKHISVKTFNVVIGDKDATFTSFVNALSTDTKLVICTHASNVCGAVIPIERIGPVCRECGITFAVDAAQSAGILDIDMQQMCIDYLCAAPHKGLYAPMGTGILVVNDKPLSTIIEGGTGTNSLELVQPDYYPERLESGTVNLPGIAGISAGIDFVNSNGIANIYKNEMNIARRIYNGLTKIEGVKVYTPLPDDNFVPVISFNVDGLDSAAVASKLNRYDIAVRSGLQCAPMAHKQLGTIKNGTVRVCPSVFTTNEQVTHLLKCVKKLNKT